ncbi:putative propionate--CoA ligase PrpE [Nocardia nova SH22a]|uniref:Putative propionate--CoA ligase PrpE n=1 Tax=Nocardia nova SH22a TaxID=1415166 RepID=W5TLP4_9NOCA|nr:acetate--CoA ligase [Nocardia nova]AHH20069.1 putative propionate--CoA ligase PrpE [Nocardia nova SH22a]
MSETQKGGVGYLELWIRSQDDREGFWLDAAQSIDWDTAPAAALEEHGDTEWRWFPGGELNLSYNALDRHVEAGRGEQTAIIYDSAMTGTKARLTYAELRDQVARFAGVLRAQGVQKGDRVLVYLPMIPQAAVAMLACARIGAVHSVVFGGFAANELAVRIKDAGPKVIVTCSGGLEPGRTVEYLPIVDRALELCGAESGVTSVIVHSRDQIQGRAADFADDDRVTWLDWETVEKDAEPTGPVPVNSDDPLYILYTSGTTGSPKGVVRDTGGYGVALSWSMQHVYDIGVGDTMFTASDVGWVVGHSYIVYGPLLAGATTIIYEGKPVGTPDAGAFWRIVAEYRVKTMFTAPTALRAVRREDPDLNHLGEHDVSSLKALFLAGERTDPETWHWIKAGLGIPIVDHWWQTETGWPICAIPLGIEVFEQKAGSTALPMPGYDVHILDSTGGRITEPDVEGNIAIKLPLPPGNLLEIWGSRQRFVDSYLTAFPGYYITGDAGHLDEDGYLFVMGRTDDVINVAGHRLSTGSLEEILTGHPSVAEAAVIGVADSLKGQRAAGFVALKHGHDIDRDRLASELIALVREVLGPVASFRDVTVLERLPKTRSGKILRKTMRQIVDGEDYRIPATIEDPTVIDDLISALDSTYHQPATVANTVAEKRSSDG